MAEKNVKSEALIKIGKLFEQKRKLWENSIKVVNSLSIIEVTNYLVQKIGFHFGIFSI